VVLFELAQRLGDSLIFFARFDAIIRALLVQREGKRNELLIGQRTGPLAATMGVDRQVARDTEQPGTKCRPGLERVDSRDSSSHALLADVLGILPVVGEVQAKSIKGIAVTSQEHPERDITAGLDHSDQVAVRRPFQV
jgi:hypothetical protein